MSTPQPAPSGSGTSPSWRRVLGRLRDPDVGGAALLLAATLAALVWVNSPWGDTYDVLWSTEVGVGAGGVGFGLTLREWVNEGLMAFFFFVVGLDVKRELVIGELADRRRVAVPALAALAGLAVPALIYVGFNLGDAAASGWGVVISTDTAFLLGLLALLGRACPAPLRVFLLALAIADDVGALTVIAVFYTSELSLVPLALAVLSLIAMLGLRRLRVWQGPAYLVLAVAGWVALYLSGVHATLLGVAIALSTPAYLTHRADVEEAERRIRAYRQSPNADFARAARLSIDRSVPPGERLQTLWQPWTTWVIVPLFALANAGVTLSAETLRAAATSSITLGVVAGLVLGKLGGVLLGTGVAVRLGLGSLAPGIGRGPLAGGAALTGLGFTISLFIVDLAFPDPATADQARIGILVASLLAGTLGSALLLAAHRRSGGAPVMVLDPPVDPDHDHVRGPVDAPLTLVGFGDFTAPWQGRGAIRELHDRYGDRFRYVFRHAPEGGHSQAQLAAEAAEAAGTQGRFWDMHDRLFEAESRLSAPDLLRYADELGLDVSRFARDLGSSSHTRRVRHDLESAQASGSAGTPTFFVGGRRHDGPHDAGTLAAALLAAESHGASEPRAGSDGGARPRTADGEDRPPSPDPADPTAADATDAAPSSAADPIPVDSPDAVPADTPETADRGGDHPRIDDDQLARLSAAGARRSTTRGDVLYRPGDDGYDFHVVLSGAVAVASEDPSGGSVVRVHGARRFLGAFDLFEDGPVTRTAVVVRDGEVLAVAVDALRGVLAEDPALRDMVMRAYLVRGAIGHELGARSTEPS